MVSDEMTPVWAVSTAVSSSFVSISTFLSSSRISVEPISVFIVAFIKCSSVCSSKALVCTFSLDSLTMGSRSLSLTSYVLTLGSVLSSASRPEKLELLTSTLVSSLN